jgi:hypothetical protein
MGDEISRWSAFGDEVVSGVLGTFPGRKSQGSLEKLEERCLARVARSNDEDTRNWETIGQRLEN